MTVLLLCKGLGQVRVKGFFVHSRGLFLHHIPLLHELVSLS